MSRCRPGRSLAVLLCGLTALAAPRSLFACAVCFGDPDSAMAKGVVAGVWVLLGVVSFVLVSLAGLGLFWIRRSRVVGATIPQDTQLS